jgi:ATP-binding cassette subfamily B protein
MFLVGSLWSVAEAGLPYVLKIIVDQLNTAGASAKSLMIPLETLWYTLFYLSCVALLEFGMRCEEYLKFKNIPHIRGEIRNYLIEYIQEHSYNFFQKNLSGGLSKRILDMTDSFQILWDACYWTVYPIVLSVILSSLLIWFTYPLLSLFLLMWFGIMVGGSAFFYQKALVYAKEHATSEKLLVGQINDRIRNIFSVKLFTRHFCEAQHLEQYQQNEIFLSQKLSRYIWKISIFRSVLSVILISTLLLTLIYRWRLGMVTVGDFVFIMGSAFSIMRISWVATEQVSTAYREFGTAQEALSVLSGPHDIKDHPHAVDLKVKEGSIVFDQVEFGYTSSALLFSNLSIVIKGGEKVGIVGFSGSGKTTFVNLLLRFFDVQKGKILIDDQDISRVKQQSLHRNIAVIPQESLLFNRRILDNISYGKPGATKEEIIAAAKAAYCHDFIMEMPEVYDTMVTENGTNLSLGQRQRLIIARAFLKNAPLIIMDEVTSALDPVTEHYIQKSLHQIMENKTALVIAHRLTTLVHMDRILVFKAGKIVEEGNHSNLLAKEGYYATLWNSQSKGFIGH